MQLIVPNYIPPPCERPRLIPHKNKSKQVSCPNIPSLQVSCPNIPSLTKTRKNRNFHIISPTAKIETSLALEMMAILSHQNPAPQYPILGPCSVSITYNFGRNPYTEITIEPLDVPLFAPPGDIDNRDKTVLDSLQKAKIFPNDKLVYQLSAKYQKV